MRTYLPFLVFAVVVVSLFGILVMVAPESPPPSCRPAGESPVFGSYTAEYNGELYTCSDI